MKIRISIRTCSFGHGYNVFIDGDYHGYYQTLEEAEQAGRYQANVLLNPAGSVVKEFDVGDDDEV